MMDTSMNTASNIASSAKVCVSPASNADNCVQRSSAPEQSRPPSTSNAPEKQNWNHPRINIWRCVASFCSFAVLGMNDGAYGALLPYLENWYHVDYVHCDFLDLRVTCLHPPYPALVTVYIFVGFGNGLGDSAWNAWIDDMTNANEVLGVLHGLYGLGAAVAPLAATTLITKAGWKCYEFYYLMIGAAAIEVCLLVGSFWRANAKVHNAEHTQDTTQDSARLSVPADAEQPHAENEKRTLKRLINSRSKTVQAIRTNVTILSSIFLLIYAGIEVSIGGWTVIFMLEVRKASQFASGMTSACLWLGIAVGRIVLGLVTGRFFKTEKQAVATYLFCSVALQLMIWLIPNFHVSAVMVSLLGFCLGPMFPAAVVALTRLLPKELHVAGIGFAAAFGMSGACILPFAVGAIANAAGVRTLEAFVAAALILCTIVWFLFPKFPKTRIDMMD